MVEELRKTPIKALAESLKLWLARRELIVVAEVVDKEKNIYRIYCPKCKTWHTVYLSGYPENEHFHLPCGETLCI